jgi:hypothetical protein
MQPHPQDTHAEAEFARALLDPSLPAPAHLTSHNAPRPGKRFDVYRNNVVVSLVNALRSRFPATERIVGGEFFAAAARVFVTRHPPRSKLLMHYGDFFPEFLSGFAPAAELPYLAGVARIEAARTRAYHAADAAPLDGSALASLEAERLPRTRFALHPSMEVLRFALPAVTIWAMNAGETDFGPVDMDAPEDALVIRPHEEVHVHRLPRGGAAFLAALQSGVPLGRAAEEAASESAAFDLTENLAGLIRSGALTGILLPDRKET